jgi:signal peptidase I
VVLGADEYFVMGDNRNNSRDSRDPSIGSINRDQLVGRAFIRVWPLNRFGLIEHQ